MGVAVIFGEKRNSYVETGLYICTVNKMFHLNTNLTMMDDYQKIRLLDELVSKTIPQSVNYTPHNGNYCVTLLALQPVGIWGGERRNFQIEGRLEENKKISATLIAEGEVVFCVDDLPYVAHEGDRTPIYKIIRASIYCAYGALRLPYLHQDMRKIAIKDFPFNKETREEQVRTEIRFMKKLAEIKTVPGNFTDATALLIHPTSTRLKTTLLYHKEYEPRSYEKIMDSIKALSPFIPAKEDAGKATPDTFVWSYDPSYPHDTFNYQVIMLNAKSKRKEQFWWDYLKLNIFLSDLEYYFGYYVLMNRWQIPTIQRWIAEYREKGYFVSQRATDYLLFYLKAGEKTSPRILNSKGVQVRVKMIPR